jgi:hypothetical protein
MQRRVGGSGNAVPGFYNFTCIADQFSSCAIQSPVSGVRFSMSWTRTNAFAFFESATQAHYLLGKLVDSSGFSDAYFSANATGLALDATVTGPFPPSLIEIGNLSDPETIKNKSAALKRKR